MGRRKRHPGFVNAPRVSITSSQAASAVSVVGRCPGALWQYLSSPAAVETASEEIAAAHGTADPIGPICESEESLNLGRSPVNAPLFYKHI